MYTQEELKELRDIIIAEYNKDKYIGAPQGRTAVYLYETFAVYGTDPKEVHKFLSDCLSSPDIDSEEEQIDYRLAYQILFGNVEIAPLHLNDALSSVASWRLRHSYDFSQNKKADQRPA